MSRAAATLLAMLALAAAGTAAWLVGDHEPAPGSARPAAEASGAARDAAAPEPSRQDARAPGRDDSYDRCMALALADPERTVQEARAWRAAGGGDAAMHCEATARLRSGDSVGAAELLEELGRSAFAPRDARASLLAQAAQIRLESGDLTRAYAAVTLALALRPDDPDMLTDRAVIAASAGRFQEAIDDLSRAIDLRPFRAEAYVLRGSAWRQLGELALARDDIARALARDPLNQEAWLESGNLRRDSGDLRGARADWEQAVRIAPDTATATIAAGNLALLGQAFEGPQALPRAAEPAAASPRQR